MTTPPATRLLDHLTEMTAAIEQAITACSVHSLSAIEDSLWHQESLTQLLRRAIHDLRLARLSEPEAQAVRSAAVRLLAVNRCYDAVVREAARTTALLQAATGSAHPHHSATPYSSLSYEI